jgi:hypothetical protein
MYIFYELVLPNGTTASYHRIQRVEIATEVVVHIASFTSHDTNLSAWQQSYVMPMTSLTSYPDSVVEWLISDTGPLTHGQMMTDPSEIEALRTRILTAIASLRDTYIGGGVETPYGRVDSDAVSIRNIMGSYQGAVLSLLAQAPYDVSWRLNNNTNVALDAMGMIAIGNAVLTHTKDCYERSWLLKDMASNPDITIDELNSLPITEGWPE